MDDNLIAAEHLTRLYGQRRAIDDVSLNLNRGEVLGFLGPNGAGKSTTMRILSGVLAPSSGQVRIAGIDLLESPRTAKARIGYLPEHPPLYRELTVDEYLAFCARLHRLPGRTAIADAVRRAKGRCGLADVGGRLLGSLSKGYQQRVGIAQAILHSPAVVILDEPTVGLDPIQIREIRTLIRELRNEHGVILSTHILPEVQAVCDRVLIIHRGRIVMNAPIIEAMGGGRWRVGFARPPQPAALAAIAGVESVESVDAQRFLLTGAGLDIDTLTREAVTHDWGLMELVPQADTLEETFVRLTCGDATDSAVAA
jgi:ABC-2 type transport system ATP-binding protein